MKEQEQKAKDNKEQASVESMGMGNDKIINQLKDDLERLDMQRDLYKRIKKFNVILHENNIPYPIKINT